MKKEYNYQEIEQYLNGEMKEEELRDFQNKLEMDASLADEVEFYKDAGKVLEIQGFIKEVESNLDKREFFAKEPENKGATTKSTILSVRRLSVKRFLAYAAALLILFALAGWWYTRTSWSNEALANVSLTEMGMERSGSDRQISEQVPGSDPFNEGISALENGQFSAAISSFSNFDADDPGYPNAQLYLAFANLELGIYQEASRNAQTAIEVSIDPALRQKAEWLLVKASLGAGNLNDALLDSIAGNNSHRFQEDAQALQKDLNSFWRKLSR